MDIAGWFCAVEAGDLEHIKETYMQFVGKINEKGRTALMIAASLGHKSICDFLARLESRQTTPKGVTALMIAAELQHIDIVAILAPYESRMRSDKVEPAIIRAARHCCMPALEILLPYEMCYASECLAVAKINRLDEVYKRIDAALASNFTESFSVHSTLVQPILPQNSLLLQSQHQSQCTQMSGLDGNVGVRVDANTDTTLQQADLITTLTTELEDLRLVEREYEDLKYTCEAYQEQIRELNLDNDTLFTDNMSLRRDKEKYLRALKRLGPCPSCKKSQSELKNLLAENTRLSTELSTIRTNSLEVWSRILMKRALSDEEIKRFAPFVDLIQ